MVISQIWIKISDMENDSLLSYVLAKLDKSKGRHREIATKCGVAYTTVRNIAQRVTPNPGVQSVQALADFFREDKRNA